MAMFSKSNSHNQSVIDALHASQAVIEFSSNGDIITANSNFLAAVGYSLKELVGAHHSLFCDPAYVKSETYRRFWRDLGAGKFQSGEFKRVTKQGQMIWLQATYNPIKNNDGKVIKIIKFAADITQDKLKSIDSIGKITAIERAQAVIEFTTDGEVITANANFLDALGYRLEEIRGRHHKMFCTPEDAHAPSYKKFWEDLANGKFQAAEYKRIGKGGVEVYIQASYNPIFDDTGVVVKIVKFSTVTTEAVTKRVRNDQIGHDVNSELGAVITQMAAATRMTSGASDASTETSSIINSVAAASEELTLSVREIGQSMTNAQEGVESVFNHTRKATQSVATLNDTATAMNSVVTFIQGIASQINLLALNATIESARAGDAGKGFAVVASEVKSLANQAAASTKSIGTEIAKMQGVTADVVDAMELISSSLTNVLENVSNVAEAIEKQHAVTGEISNNMQTAVTAVQHIGDSLEHISEIFSMVAQASEGVKQNIETLVA